MERRPKQVVRAVVGDEVAGAIVKRAGELLAAGDRAAVALLQAGAAAAHESLRGGVARLLGALAKPGSGRRR